MISSDLSTANAFDFNLAGEARSQGLEAALKGSLTTQWTASLTYAYTDARYGHNAVYGGKQVPNAARHAFNLWGQYDWGQGWTSAATLAVQSRRFADEANTTVLPGYARLDLLQGWTTRLSADQSLSLQLAVKNLFDKGYFVSSHLHVSRWITPAEGRHLSVTASYRF